MFDEEGDEEEPQDYQEVFDQVWTVLDEDKTGALPWKVISILFRLLGISEGWITSVIPQGEQIDKKTDIVKRRMEIRKLQYSHPSPTALPITLLIPAV